jgi:hypothetical protein
MMKSYFLVQGAERLECGNTEPRYDAEARAWITAAGNVADFDGSAFHVTVEDEATVQGDPPTPEALAAIARQFEVMLDDHVDATAKSMGYLNTLSAVSYADEPAVPRFQVEGQAFRAWRSRVYARAIEVQGEVLRGERLPPTPSELLGLMPAFERPVV